MSAAGLVLPTIVPRFRGAYPEIRLEVIAEESFVDMLAADSDAGIRYEERLWQEMMAIEDDGRQHRRSFLNASSFGGQFTPPPKYLVGV